MPRSTTGASHFCFIKLHASTVGTPRSSGPLSPVVVSPIRASLGTHPPASNSSPRTPIAQRWSLAIACRRVRAGPYGIWLCLRTCHPVVVLWERKAVVRVVGKAPLPAGEAEASSSAEALIGAVSMIMRERLWGLLLAAVPRRIPAFAPWHSCETRLRRPSKVVSPVVLLPCSMGAEAVYALPCGPGADASNRV